jgi:Mn-dependent DtxR family transcriptional regulator
MHEVTECAYEFIRSFVAENGYAPTVSEVAAGIGMSRGAARHHMSRLEQMGLLVTSGMERGVRVTSPQERRRMKYRTLERMWLDGAPIKAIACELGWSMSTVSTRARQMGLPKRRGGVKPRLTQAQVERMANDRERGVSREDLARRYGVTTRTVDRYLAKLRRQGAAGAS